MWGPDGLCSPITRSKWHHSGTPAVGPRDQGGIEAPPGPLASAPPRMVPTWPPGSSPPLQAHGARGRRRAPRAPGEEAARSSCCDRERHRHREAWLYFMLGSKAPSPATLQGREHCPPGLLGPLVQSHRAKSRAGSFPGGVPRPRGPRAHRAASWSGWPCRREGGAGPAASAEGRVGGPGAVPGRGWGPRRGLGGRGLPACFL